MPLYASKIAVCDRAEALARGVRRGRRHERIHKYRVPLEHLIGLFILGPRAGRKPNTRRRSHYPCCRESLDRLSLHAHHLRGVSFAATVECAKCRVEGERSDTSRARETKWKDRHQGRSPNCCGRGATATTERWSSSCARRNGIAPNRPRIYGTGTPRPHAAGHRARQRGLSPADRRPPGALAGPRAFSASPRG